jgi:hypothetical protein
MYKFSLSFYLTMLSVSSLYSVDDRMINECGMRIEGENSSTRKVLPQYFLSTTYPTWLDIEPEPSRWEAGDETPKLGFGWCSVLIASYIKRLPSNETSVSTASDTNKNRLWLPRNRQKYWRGEDFRENVNLFWHMKPNRKHEAQQGEWNQEMEPCLNLIRYSAYPYTALISGTVHSSRSSNTVVWARHVARTREKCV